MSDAATADTATDETTDETDTSTGTEEKPDTGTTEDTDWKAEAEKFRSLHKKQEARAKANADAAEELARIKAENQTPSEKALGDAEAKGYAKARGESLQALAGARIEAALTGIVEDPAEFVDDLNLAKFVTSDGEVDIEAISALKAKYQKAAKTSPGSADGGARSRDTKPTRSTSIEDAVTRKFTTSGA